LFGSFDPAIIGVVGLFAFATFFLAILAALAWDSYRSGLARAPSKAAS
jgi:hypothetical protein